MAIPKEAMLAAFPPRRMVGKFTIHSPALIHLFALGACGNPVVSGNDQPTMQQQVEVFAVLSLDPDQVAMLFASGSEQGAAQIASLRDRITIKTPSAIILSAVSISMVALAEAMACFVPTRDPNAGDEMDATRIDNWGWPLVATEFVINRYPAYDFDQAIRMPLVRMFSCRVLAEVLREGKVPSAPSYGERAYIDAIAGQPAGV